MSGGLVESAPMAAVDAANLASERGQPNVVTLAGLLAPGGCVDAAGTPDVAALRAVLAPRIRRAAALHRAAAKVEGRWTWRTVVLDLEHHIRVIEPEPEPEPEPEGSGSATGFERTCARAVMEPVDAARPPWEILLVPRADGDRCGLLFRVHHALADGLGAEALIGALSDPVAQPGGVAAGHAAARPPLADPAAAPRSRLRRLADLAAQTTAVLRRSVRSRTLLGPLGPTRDVAFVDVDLARLHAGARRAGGTVGDAFLAAFGEGLRALLVAAGEEPPSEVPVSSPVRIARRGGEGNATGVMLVPVPVAAAATPGERVARVAARSRPEKARARAVGTFRPMSGPRAARLLMYFARRQRAIAAIASELPGPATTLRLGGAELVAAWPLALLSGNVRVGALAVSYAGRLRVSLQTDAVHLPPARVVADAMAAELHLVADIGAV